METVSAQRKPRRKKEPLPPTPETTPEFRAEAHARLDRLLDMQAGSDTLLIAVDGLSGTDADSIPSSLSVKKGITLDLFRKLFPEGT
jgi:hypothetical protein